MTALYPVAGSYENGNPSWNTLIQDMGQGWDGIVRLAHKVFYSLPKHEATNNYEEDIVQDALHAVYLATKAQDTGTVKDPVAWASVVMKHSMLRSIQKTEAWDEATDVNDMDLLDECNEYKELERKLIVQSLLDQASGDMIQVLSKIMYRVPLTRNERRKWNRYRFNTRSELIKQGVTSSA